MTAQEIVETLLNGNVALAREEIPLPGSTALGAGRYRTAVLALDVVSELGDRFQDGWALTTDRTPPHLLALRKVRRCLEVEN